jgi:hypothetical protein
MSSTDGSTTKYALLFAAGTMLGSVLAFGAAYGLASAWASQDRDDSQQQQLQQQQGGRTR